jgi:hypothetical protein
VKRISVLVVATIISAAGCFGDDLRLWTPEDAEAPGDMLGAGGSHDATATRDGSFDENAPHPVVDASGPTDGAGDSPLPTREADALLAADMGAADPDGAKQEVDAPMDAMPAADMGAAGPDGAKQEVDAPIGPPAVDAPGAKLAIGDRCSSPGQCGSSFCTEGVCCRESCAGACRSCLGSNTGLSDGTCGPVRPGLDPRNDCDSSSHESCGHDGTCDGAGACQNWGADIVCAPEACADGAHAAERRCNGKGQCSPGTAGACAPYLCEGAHCRTRCSSEADCVAGSFCANGSCGGKKAQGAGCLANAECGSGTCSDGVCCESECSGKCSSCKFAETGLPDGTCAPVRAGTDSGGDCAASDPSTCGQDGKCDGLGGCRKHVAGTVCSTAACSNNRTEALPTRMCNGQGTCGAADGLSCGKYLCEGSHCMTSCSSNSDCSSQYYCPSGSCETKKILGSMCSDNSECVSGICGGRCCDKTCNCGPSTMGNLVQNGDFDENIAGWSLSPVSNATAVYEWSNEHNAGSCPYSGAIVLYVEGTRAKSRVSQCLPPIQDSVQYSVGFDIFLSDEFGNGSGQCDFEWYDGPACGGNSLNDFDYPFDTGHGSWQTFTKAVFPPPGAKSVMASCQAMADGPSGMAVWFDRVFLTPAP